MASGPGFDNMSPVNVAASRVRPDTVHRQAASPDAHLPPTTRGVRPSRVPVTQPGDALEQRAETIADRIAPRPVDSAPTRPSPVSVAPSTVWTVLEAPGRPLTPAERPGGLGLDFSSVRVHSGPMAAASARSLAASAYSIGDDIVLGAPLDTSSVVGRRRLAHELAHVVQHRERPDRPILARDGSGQTGSASVSDTLTFIIRKPGDKFIQDETSYQTTTRHGEQYIEVDNLDDICAQAAAITKSGTQFQHIRVVTHGQSNIGGIGMTPPGQDWQFVPPDEIAKYAEKPGCQALSKLLTDSGDVTFVGCYLGSTPKAGEALRKVFGHPVNSTARAYHVAFAEFVFHDAKKKKNIKADKVADVPTDKNTQQQFTTWLKQQYMTMLKAGDAPKLDSVDKQLSFMRDLFDRSNGTLRWSVTTAK